MGWLFGIIEFIPPRPIETACLPYLLILSEVPICAIVYIFFEFFKNKIK